MGDDHLNVELAPSDVFQRLRGALRKVSETEGTGFIEAYLEDAHIKIQIEPENQGSELKISY
jgi:hypothetical protein